MSVTKPQFQDIRHVVETCVADFQVGSENGPLCSPDRILASFRQEILPALDQLLHSDRLADTYAQVGALEIDLGQWPEDPDWSAIRAVFLEQLESALEPYLHWRSNTLGPQPSERPGNLISSHLPGSEPISVPTLQAANAAASDQTEYQPDSPAVQSRSGNLLQAIHQSSAELHAYIERTLARNSDTGRAILAQLFRDPDLQTRLLSKHGSEMLMHIRTMMVVAHHPSIGPPTAQKRDRPVAPQWVKPLDLLDQLSGDTDHPAERSALATLQEAFRHPLTEDPEAFISESDTTAPFQRSADLLDTVSQTLTGLSETTMSRLDSLLAEPVSDETELAPTSDRKQDSKETTADVEQAEMVKLGAVSQLLKKLLAGAGHSESDARLMAASIGARLGEVSDSSEVAGISESLASDSRNEQQTDTRDQTRFYPPTNEDTSSTSPTISKGQGVSSSLPPPSSDNLATSERKVATSVDLPNDKSPATRADSAGPALIPDAFGTWAAWLIDPGTSAKHVSVYWPSARDNISMALADFPTSDLTHLIDKLGPKNAEAFSAAVENLSRTATNPKAGLTYLLQEILENRPLDIAAALEAGNDKSPGSGTPISQNSSAEAHQPVGNGSGEPNVSDEKPPHMDKRASQHEHHESLWVEVLRAIGHDEALISAAFGLIDRSLAGSADAGLTGPNEPNASESTPTETAARVGAASLDQAKSSLNTEASGLHAEKVTVLEEQAAALNELRPTMEAIIGAYTDRQDSDVFQHWRAALDLLWTALPRSARRDISARAQEIANATRMPQDRQAASKIISAEDGSPETTLDLPESDPRYWKILLKQSVSPRPKNQSLATFIDDALHDILPDPDRYTSVLRHLIARLSYTSGRPEPALRKEVLAALNDIAKSSFSVLESVVSSHEPGQTPSEINGKTAQEEDGERLFTMRAGLVLFHPYLKMLFERLDLLDDASCIRPESLPSARATLRHISLGKSQDDRTTDLMEKVLLGLPPNWKVTDSDLVDAPDTDIIDGLIDAVINQWGALGQTSPDGLREVFVRRSGTLSFEENSIHLTVDPGPFDMLLDKLPWSFGTIALPWMDLPCYVEWR